MGLVVLNLELRCEEELYASDNSGDRGASVGTVVIANEFHVISVRAISDRRAI